jgi:hypothetical protein
LNPINSRENQLNLNNTHSLNSRIKNNIQINLLEINLMNSLNYLKSLLTINSFKEPSLLLLKHLIIKFVNSHYLLNFSFKIILCK